MKIKKVPSSKPRSEIVVDNIFMFLEKKHLKQKDLAEVCLVNASDVSKWKNYKTKINMDDLEKIADFLQVPIDDLFYTEEEKKRCVPELKGKVDPSTVLTQRLVKVIMGAANQKTHVTLLIYIFTFLLGLFFCIAYLDIGKFNIFLLIALIIGIICVLSQETKEETFVLNYMSDLFYKIENPNNQFFVYELVTKIISSICVLPFTIFFIYILVDSYNSVALSMAIIIFIYLIMLVLNFICTRKTYKEEVYHWEFDLYYLRLYALFFSGIIFTIFLYITIFDYLPWQFITLSSIDLVARIIEYILCSIKSAEYKIAMIDENKVISYL